MSAGPDWPKMFRALAEGWHWTPSQVEGLTPQQVIHLSGGEGGPAGGGGGVAIAHPSQLDDIRERWLAWNSEAALLRRAERLYARHLQTGQ